ncbi:fimbrial protein [Pararobbsia silviterrae]|uniref:Fimbrial protein n=1 Tax=Pararobbsia silviterrae TaxID=1792498 RepID=A0A494XHY4_9BURK|nr:fimbrial protein [Pararobbsia silviterrae]RKP50260.1 fimbrial protein [Pararobbsia silviterrae]
MNASVEPLAEREIVDHFVLASNDPAHVFWLTSGLQAAGAVEATRIDAEALAQRIGVINPSIVFLDFTGEQGGAATEAASTIRASFPDLPIIALGAMSDAGSALAALRAGVRDFVDTQSPMEDALRITRDVLANLGDVVVRRGKLTVLLGARIGIGVSTLAANLAYRLQIQNRDHAEHEARAQRRRHTDHPVALLDLGLPAHDSTLHLNTRCEFDFVDAVRNVRRIDQTFVHTALSRHESGLALLSLPFDLGAMREVSFAGAIGLVNRFRAFFDQQIVDLGGFSNTAFTAHLARAADEVWLVCDQGVASIVSAVALLDELKGLDVDIGAIRLIVNKFDPGLSLTPEQVAHRLELPLAAVVPARAVPLGRAINQGTLLAEQAERDPYVRALDALIGRLEPEPMSSPIEHAGLGARLPLGRFLSSSRKRVSSR